MSSDIKEDVVEEKSQETEVKKKVTVKVPTKRRVTIKKRVEVKEEEASPSEKTTTDDVTTEKENKPTKITKKREHTSHPRAKKHKEESKSEELPLFQETIAPLENEEVSVTINEDKTNSEEKIEPITITEEIVPLPSSEDEKREDEPSIDEEGVASEKTEESTTEEEKKSEQKKDKYSRDGRNKFKNKKERRVVEEIPPEINLDENPDAPQLFISVLTALPLDAIRNKAKEAGLSEDVILDCRKQELIIRILRHHSSLGGALMVEGVLETLNEGGYGYIRYSVNNYLPGSDDVYISSSTIKSVGLRTGDTVLAQIRAPRENEKYASVVRVLKVNGEEPKMAKLRAPFDSLTPLFPDERLNLEIVEEGKKSDLSTRVVDLFCPIGKGQRSLIVAPPRTGKTVLMQKIANAITYNHPEVILMILLVDERPEEVTDMKRNVKAEVVASTFDEQATHHVQVAEMVIEKAKRLVEYKKDVVILLDSITRLARAYNQTVPASGKILSGGVDSNALHKPKRFFGAARNIENGGSLTIISTALIETGSRMDEVIFEEFKGTGNNEIVLDRKMADNRKFPAINIKKSGTRRDDLLLDESVLARVFLLRSSFGNLDDIDMSVDIIDKMAKTNNNKEFLNSMNTPVRG